MASSLQEIVVVAAARAPFPCPPPPPLLPPSRLPPCPPPPRLPINELVDKPIDKPVDELVDTPFDKLVHERLLLVRPLEDVLAQVAQHHVVLHPRPVGPLH